MADDGEVAVMFCCVGTRARVANELRAMLEHVERGDVVNQAGNPRTTIRPSGWTTSGEEPMDGRYYGVFPDREGGAPAIALFNGKEEAEIFASGLDGADHAVCRVDVVGSVWNSYNPDPYVEVAT